MKSFLLVLLILTEILAESFTIGSTKNDVVKVQGVPTTVHSTCWFYGSSYVDFDSDGLVSSWSDRAGQLKVSLYGVESNAAKRSDSREVVKSKDVYTPRTSTSYSTRTYNSSLGVAENGSYYGQTSTITGKPKTVYVNGYYRRDGTYVRGHYRSK